MDKLISVALSLTLVPLQAFPQGGITSASIVTDSPFLPPGFNPPGGAGSETVAPASASQLQFKGVYQLGGDFYFNVYDTREQKGSWIRADQISPGQPQVIEYQPKDDVLVVESGGARLRLAMIETSDKALPLPGARKPNNNPAAAQREAVTPTRRQIIRPASPAAGDATKPVTRRRIITPRPSGS